MLGILPPHRVVQDFVTSQHSARYESLKHTLVVIRRVYATFPDIPSLYLQLRLLERGELLLKTPRDGAGICPHNHCVARMISDMFHDELDGYLIYLKVTEIQEQAKGMQSTLVRCVIHNKHTVG